MLITVFRTFLAADGEQCTIVEFEHEEGLRTWHTNAEHITAQKNARLKYYTEYSVQVCTLDRESRFNEAENRGKGADLTSARQAAIKSTNRAFR